MKLYSFPLGPLETNCYVVADEATGRCAIVDPGDDGAAVAQWLEQQQLTPAYLFLTHGHYDHVGGIADLRPNTRTCRSMSTPPISPCRPR